MTLHPTHTATTAKAEAWESEGGSETPARLARSLGVVSHTTQTYSVGEYHYTNIADAIAQARRMTRLESELL